jgi:hypothetical protein
MSSSSLNRHSTVVRYRLRAIIQNMIIFSMFYRIDRIERYSTIPDYPLQRIRRDVNSGI